MFFFRSLILDAPFFLQNTKWPLNLCITQVLVAFCFQSPEGFFCASRFGRPALKFNQWFKESYHMVREQWKESPYYKLFGAGFGVCSFLGVFEILLEYQNASCLAGFFSNKFSACNHHSIRSYHLTHSPRSGYAPNVRMVRLLKKPNLSGERNSWERCCQRKSEGSMKTPSITWLSLFEKPWWPPYFPWGNGWFYV